jgi:hypothetical protein
VSPEQTPSQPAIDPYEQEVPEVIRHTVSREEWSWLSDAEKARLVQDMTEPEA